MSNFRVGGEVVCIKSHPKGYFKEGDIFVCKGIKQTPCCGALAINVGVKTQLTHMTCKCGVVRPNEDYYSAINFIPLDDISIDEAIEVLQKEPFGV